jgi:hypothetical protein
MRSLSTQVKTISTLLTAVIAVPNANEPVVQWFSFFLKSLVIPRGTEMSSLGWRKEGKKRRHFSDFFKRPLSSVSFLEVFFSQEVAELAQLSRSQS